jgi:Ca2+-binding EF-hand superfamily protein
MTTNKLIIYFIFFPQQGNKSYSITAGKKFDVADRDHCKFYVSSTGQTKKASLAVVFDEIDTNGNSLISINELKKFFKKKGVMVWTPQEFSDLWSDADSDGDAQIDFREFKRVMTAAKSGYSTHPKWRELLAALDDGAGTSTEVKLYRVDGHGDSLVAITHAVGTSGSFRRELFNEGYEYFITLNEADTRNNMELARTNVFECIDSDAYIKAQVAARLARDRAAARSVKARADRRKFHLAEQNKRFKLARKAEKNDLIDRIEQRKQSGKKRTKVSRNAAVVIDHVFDDIDTNGNGQISINELKKYINARGAPVTTSDIGQMFRAADLNSDAQLNKVEFRRVMKQAKSCSSTPQWNQLYQSHENRIAPTRSAKRRRF